MAKFIIELDGGGNPQCLIELRGVAFEAAEELMHSCMSEVDGIQSMGCSGGMKTELLISGTTVQSVLDSVVYCVSCTDSGVVVPTNSR